MNLRILNNSYNITYVIFEGGRTNEFCYLNTIPHTAPLYKVFERYGIN